VNEVLTGDDEAKESTKDEDIIAEAAELLEETKSAWRDIYDAAQEDLEFGGGKQWDDRDKELRGDRPALTINRMPQFIHQVVNEIRQNTPTIKVLPVDSKADIKTAEILQDLIRNIEKVSKADAAYDTAAEYAVKCGIGFIRVDHDYTSPDSFEQHILINRVVDPLSVFLDPMSVEPDGRDATFGFVVEQMSVEQFKKSYPDSKVENFETETLNRGGFKAQDKMITIAEYFRQESEEKEISQLEDGAVVFSDKVDGRKVLSTRKIKKNIVKRYKMTGAEVLEKTTFPSSYIPLIPVYGEETWIRGKRHLYSLIRHAKDPQRMHNFWASLETELIAEAPRSPWVVDAEAIEGYEDEWKNPAKKKVLRYNSMTSMGTQRQKPYREPPTPVPTAVVNARMGTVDDMKATMGMYDNSLGQQGNEQSGKAILAREHQGDTATFHFGDNQARSVNHVGVIAVDMIPKIYDTERVIRILGEDSTPKSIPINGAAPLDPNDKSAYNSRGEIHDLRVGKYDVAVSTGPAYATKRQEGAQALMELSAANPIIAQAAPDLLVESLDIPGASMIAKRIKKALPPQLTADDDAEQSPEVIQLQGALQQMQQQMQMMGQELQAAQNDQQAKQAEIQLKAKELQIKEAELQLNAVKHQDEMQDRAQNRLTDLDKARLDGEIKLALENMKATASVQNEAIKAEAATRASDNQTFAQLNTQEKE
jgi:hypothetical protein